MQPSGLSSEVTVEAPSCWPSDVTWNDNMAGGSFKGHSGIISYAHCSSGTRLEKGRCDPRLALPIPCNNCAKASQSHLCYLAL